jgi:hypothetical protein
LPVGPLPVHGWHSIARVEFQRTVALRKLFLDTVVDPYWHDSDLQGLALSVVGFLTDG